MPINNKQDTLEEIELTRLIGLTAAGDKRAFEEVYHKCKLPLYTLLLRILKIEEVAQEALQETFLKIWRYSDQFSAAKSNPMAWMTRIAKNQAIDTLRFKKIRPDHDLNDRNYAIEMLEDTQPDGMSSDSVNEELLLCLAELDEKPRYCVVRAYCEGYSHEELSNLTGSPVGTVKSWIRRSLLSLKRCIDEYNK